MRVFMGLRPTAASFPSGDARSLDDRRAMFAVRREFSICGKQYFKASFRAPFANSARLSPGS
jgi:hypothetical protein